MSLDQKHHWKNPRFLTLVKTHSAAEIRNISPMALPIIKSSIYQQNSCVTTASGTSVL